ncbi:MAG TPA: hypothetical protein VIK77_05170 [Tissierellaceae bacterium]
MYENTVEKDYERFIGYIKKNTSKYVKEELKYFFPVYDNITLDLYFSVGFIIYKWAMTRNLDINTVEGIIKIIENAKEEEIFINVLANLFYQYEEKLLDENYDIKEMNSIDKMLEILESIDFRDAERRNRI